MADICANALPLNIQKRIEVDCPRIIGGSDAVKSAGDRPDGFTLRVLFAFACCQNCCGTNDVGCSLQCNLPRAGKRLTLGTAGVGDGGIDPAEIQQREADCAAKLRGLRQ